MFNLSYGYNTAEMDIYLSITFRYAETSLPLPYLVLSVRSPGAECLVCVRYRHGDSSGQGSVARAGGGQVRKRRSQPLPFHISSHFYDNLAKNLHFALEIIFLKENTHCARKFILFSFIAGFYLDPFKWGGIHPDEGDCAYALRDIF